MKQGTLETRGTMSKVLDAVKESIASKPKATTAAWTLVLLLVEVGGVVADSGTAGP